MDVADIQSLIENDEMAGVFRMHRSTFTDPDILLLERERIFDRCWIYAGHESELRSAGDFFARTIANKRIIVSRGKGGELQAFYNTCTHKGAIVCRESAGNSKGFRCPYHSWFFDAAGKLVTVPKEEAYGPHFDKRDYNLERVAHVDSCHGFIFICLAQEAETLTQYLAGAVDMLETVAAQGEHGMEVSNGTNFYTMKTNWKLLLENSSDAYHVLPVHGRYVGFLEDTMGSEEMRRLTAATQGAVRELGNGHCVIEVTPPMGGRPTAYWDPSFGEERRERIATRRKWFADKYGEERAKVICDQSRVVQIFPNLMVIDTMSVSIRQFAPTDPSSLDVTAWALVPVEQRADDRAFNLRTFATFFGPGGFATPDDIDVLESCQQGFLHSDVEWAYNSRGMLSNANELDSENQMRAFWERWHQLMLRPPAEASSQIGAALLTVA